MYERDMNNEQIIITRLDTVIELLQELIEFEKETFGFQSDAWENDVENCTCGNVGCNHHIDHHKLFGGCQVSECSCEQFYRKINNA